MFHLPRHERCSSLFIEKVRHIPDSDLDALSSPEARKAYNMAREVAGDSHRTLAYIRFQLFRERVLWSEAKPKHRVEDMVFSYLRKRYPHFGLVLKTQRGYFGVWPDGELIRWPVEKDMNDVLAEVAAKVPEKAVWWDDQGEGLWDTFYNSQFISSRKNLPLFYKAMPKYYLENFPGLGVECRRVENGTLDAYIEEV